jgi:hypothetical protein
MVYNRTHTVKAIQNNVEQVRIYLGENSKY